MAADPEDHDADPAASDENAASADAGMNVAQLAAERDKYLEMARRTRAEFENYQKRVARDWETDRKYAASALLMDLLPALDNLDRALESAKGQPDPTGIVAGVELVRKQLADTLARHGVQPIVPTTEELFDPTHHEAILQQPSAQHPPMTVMAVAQTGYKLHDRVLRPAQVVVAAAPSE